MVGSSISRWIRQTRWLTWIHVTSFMDSSHSMVRLIQLGLRRCRRKVRESGVCEQFALIMIVRVIICVVLGEFCLGELPFAPTMGRWLIMRCPLFTIHFSLFTSHRPSFQAHNDTDSGNTIVDGRDYSLSIAIQRLTTSVCPKNF